MLAIYRKDGDSFTEITTSGDLTEPIVTAHDGQTGGVVTLQLYLRNDESTLWYSNVTIRPVDLVEAYPYGDVAYTETGWGVKLSQGSDEPTTAEWEDIEWGNTIDMPDVGSSSLANTTTYSPFWYLISCPPNLDAITKTDIVLRTSWTENAVT
jgi:hypothetical protein